ncbi:MAG: hypothetical protein CVT82_15470 [Alphaproteobacteria bacterium HGW-Alphaproteobacteria-4]|nr:MAG: hypothetical protein CVT82_15470 [Alphaproteobacteria bacterium HGW-Alphaproteobacteria-4]
MPQRQCRPSQRERFVVGGDLRNIIAPTVAAWWPTSQIPQDFEGFADAAKKMRRSRKSLLQVSAQVRKYPFTAAANTATARRKRRKALKAKRKLKIDLAGCAER